MSIVQTNISSENDIDLYPVPTKSDGSYYQYELIDSAAWARVYSDDIKELMEYLIPEYTGEYTQRLNHAISMQVKIQAQILSYYLDADVTDEEYSILVGPRHIQPEIKLWTSQVPLILIDSFYEPYTNTTPPVGNFIEKNDNILWIEVAKSESTYLKSLDYLGLFQFNILQSEAV
jgi:hypothetical protein